MDSDEYVLMTSESAMFSTSLDLQGSLRESFMCNPQANIKVAGTKSLLPENFYTGHLHAFGPLAGPGRQDSF